MNTAAPSFVDLSGATAGTPPQSVTTRNLMGFRDGVRGRERPSSAISCRCVDHQRTPARARGGAKEKGADASAFGRGVY